MKLKITHKQIFTILALTFCVGVRVAGQSGGQAPNQTNEPEIVDTQNPDVNTDTKKTTWSSILENIKKVKDHKMKTTLFAVFVIGAIVFYKYFYKKKEKEKNLESIEELDKNNSKGL